jgi:hypothetical protein
VRRLSGPERARRSPAPGSARGCDATNRNRDCRAAAIRATHRRGGRFRPLPPRARPIGPRRLVTRDSVARPEQTRDDRAYRLQRLLPRARATARRASPTSNARAAPGGARGGGAPRNRDRWPRHSAGQPSRPPAALLAMIAVLVNRRVIGALKCDVGLANPLRAGPRVSSLAYFPQPANREDVDMRRMKA